MADTRPGASTKSGGQNFKQAVLIPACPEAFVFHSWLVGFFLFEHTQRETIDSREVFRGVSGAQAVLVFCKCGIEHPVQAVFNLPMPAYRLSDGLRVRGRLLMKYRRSLLT